MINPTYTAEFNIEDIVAAENNGINDNIEYSKMLAHSIEAVLQHLKSTTFFLSSDSKEQIGLHKDVLIRYTTTNYTFDANAYGTNEGIFTETLSISLYSFSTDPSNIQKEITDLVKQTCQEHKEIDKEQEIERLTTILTTKQFPEFPQTDSDERDKYVKGICKTIASLAKEYPSHLDYCIEQSTRLFNDPEEPTSFGFYLWNAITIEFEGDEHLKQKTRTFLSKPSPTLTERYMGIENSSGLDKNECPPLLARIVGDSNEELLIRVRASSILMLLIPYIDTETQSEYFSSLSKLKQDIDQTDTTNYRNSLPTHFYKWIFDNSKSEFLKDYTRLESVKR